MMKRRLIDVNDTLSKSWFPINDLNLQNIASGMVAGIFIITGPSILILEAAANGGFTDFQTSLWMFSVYVFGGLFGMFLPLHYKIPIVGGHSLTGVAFLVTVTPQFSFQQLIGAYVVSGILMFIIGALGVFSKFVQLIPKEIISAMLAGMIMKYMVNFVVSANQLWLVGSLSIITFLAFSKWKLRIPPVIAAIVVGFVVMLLFYPLNKTGSSFDVLIPSIQTPEFNLVSILSVSIPLALLILSNDAAVAIGGLQQKNYQTPINKLVSFSGIFSILTSFFGGQSANAAGMATVICAGEEAGPKEKRYMGAVVTGILLLIFGLFSWKLIPMIQVLPQEFIAVVVGFSLIGVFGNSLYQSFAKESMKMSTTFAFIIAFSNISIMNISAPVISLLIGTFVAYFVETDLKISS